LTFITGPTKTVTFGVPLGATHDQRSANLTGTRNHPVWTGDDFGWVPLGDLKPGDQVACQFGHAIVQSVTCFEQSQPVYNLETYGEHVYEVTELGILVHNNTFCLKELAELINIVGPRTPEQSARLAELTQMAAEKLAKGEITKEALKKAGLADNFISKLAPVKGLRGSVQD
jgi:hypothetical protein